MRLQCVVVTSLEEAIASAADIHSDEIFIIGGAEVYQQLLPHIERIYLTIVHDTFEGDAFFPELDPNEWRESSRELHEEDDENEYACSFVVMERV